MKYNFDEVIDRTNTNCLKYDFSRERKKAEGLLPLWIADMDFRVPQEVTDALNRAVAHGIYGYTEVKDDYYEVVNKWFEDHFHWRTKREWLVKTPGIIYAIVAAIRAFTREGDAVMIQNPVYYPFGEAVHNNNRKLVNNALIQTENGYRMDLEDMERKIIEEKVRIFILCSPHNPVDRVWTREELNQVSQICNRHHVLVISDEIHCDFAYEGVQHTVFASISEAAEQNCIICTSPSKTFNLAGLQVSNIFIPNEKLRCAFKKEIAATGYSQLNTLGLVAAQAAYQYGSEWLTELKGYLQENLNFVDRYLTEHLPKVHLIRPEGTYLIWLDFREYGLTDQELDEKMIHQAGLWLDAGRMFGTEGSGFMRMNIACPRSILQEALQRIESTFFIVNSY